MPVRLSTLAGRKNFATLLTDRGLTGTAVEIGTHKGKFAEQLLRDWKGTLYCVDPWLPYTDMPGRTDQERNDDYDECLRRLRHFHTRAKMLKTTSREAIGRFGDESLDFVYIDGSHQPEDVQHDVYGWWPKLKPGGIYAGHDILSAMNPGTGWDRYVEPILRVFAKDRGLILWYVPELPRNNWSWYVEKP